MVRAKAWTTCFFLLSWPVQQVEGIIKELYSLNICKQRNCINPVFPAMNDLLLLEAQSWTKHLVSDVSMHLEFCSQIVNYDVALPEPIQPVSAKANLTLEDRVSEQDKKASLTYFYHLSGMGIDPWDQVVVKKDRCAESVARMACFTYFPRADTVSEGKQVRYVRPCRSSCEQYIQECGVQCCDDRTSCVWDSWATQTGSPDTTARQTQNAEGATVTLQTGYVDDAGSSGLCTERHEDSVLRGH